MPPDEGLTFPQPRADAVRRSVAAAFDGLKPPAETALVLPRLVTAKLAPEILRVFGGRKWTELDLPFLRERWSCFEYFTPEAFRYYLPALLTRSLDAGTDFKFIHSVVFKLRPDWYALFESSDDFVPDPAGALLDAAQQGAVAEYLHLFLDAERKLAWTAADAAGEEWPGKHYRRRERQIKGDAADALRWRWNKVETPGLLAARGFFAALDREEPELPADEEARGLARRIESAFADAPKPDPTDIVNSMLSEEPMEIAVQFRGRDWRNIGPGLLSRNGSALSFFSQKAFRYYLPAFMIADLAGTGSNADPVFHLTHHLTGQADPGERINWRAYATDRFSVFSRKEREAIAAYLEYRAKAGSFPIGGIERALENYWRPSIAETGS